jgi:hypothetical protein
MKFLALCACEKIIIDKNGAHSLITIMSNTDINFAAPPGQTLPDEIPTNAVFPREWWVFSMWQPSDDEVGKTFEQVFEVYWPNGEKFGESKIEFTSDEKVQYNSLLMAGFPVGQIGNVRVVTWIEKQGSRITEPIDYCLRVKHLPRQPGSTPGAGPVALQ